MAKLANGLLCAENSTTDGLVITHGEFDDRAPSAERRRAPSPTASAEGGGAQGCAGLQVRADDVLVHCIVVLSAELTSAILLAHRNRHPRRDRFLHGYDRQLQGSGRGRRSDASEYCYLCR